MHVPKTAGSALRARLLDCFPELRRPPALHRALSKLLHQSGICSNQDQARKYLWEHASASECKLILGSDYSSRFSFGFVRNPFDWQASYYSFMRKTSSHPLNSFCRRFSFKEYLLSGVGNARRTQLSILGDVDGNIIVDYVGKYESLDAGWAIVASRLGCDPSPLPIVNSSTRSRRLSDIYDSESEDIVRTVFRSDFEAFGYGFDLPRLG